MDLAKVQLAIGHNVDAAQNCVRSEVVRRLVLNTCGCPVLQQRSLPGVWKGRRETTEASHRQPSSSDAVGVPRTLGVIPDEDATGRQVIDGGQRACDPGSTVDADHVELPTYLRQRIGISGKVELILARSTGPHLRVSGRLGRDLDQINGVIHLRLVQNATHDVREGGIVLDAVHLRTAPP